MRLLSIVIPAKDEGVSLPELLARLASVLDQLDVPSEVVIVDDGSSDETWAITKAAAVEDPRVRGIRLSRNFGHQAALSAGLDAARGDGVIIMDADLQHPPEVIPTVLARVSEGYDVVYAVRGRRDQASWFKRTSAALFYAVFNALSGLELPPSAGDFRFMSRRVVDVLRDMPERHRFLRGMTRWAGFDQSVVHYERPARNGGASKYTLRRMLVLAWDALLSFSSVPLQLAGLIGAGVSLLGFGYLAYVIAIRAFTDRALPGWTSVMAAVLIIGGAQLVCLAVIGQYLARTYDETKKRPLFVVAETVVGKRANAPQVSRRVPRRSGSPQTRENADLPVHAPS